MASLIQVRDLLALQGRMEAKQLSLSLHTPQPMIDAMLERLEAMGKAVRIQEEPDGCLSGSCKSCPEGKPVSGSGGRFADKTGQRRTKLSRMRDERRMCRFGNHH